MEIYPETLEFSAPFNEQSTKPLILTNDTKDTLAYKIKTTAPKLYCVRPNASIIPPGEKVEVSIIRQGKEVPNPETKHKDKFLVLSAKVSDVDETANFADVWADIETNNKKSIDSKKIRVSYIYHPPPSPPSEEVELTSANAGSRPDSLKDDSHHVGNDTAGSIGEFDTPAKSVAPTAPVPANVLGSGPQSENGESNGNTTGANFSSTTATKREIDQAKEKISSMSKEIKQEPSQAKTASAPSTSASSSSNKPQAAVAQQIRQQPNGVPVPVVLALTLVAFFIGWKFF